MLFRPNVFYFALRKCAIGGRGGETVSKPKERKEPSFAMD